MLSSTIFELISIRLLFCDASDVIFPFNIVNADKLLDEIVHVWFPRDTIKNVPINVDR